MAQRTIPPSLPLRAATEALPQGRRVLDEVKRAWDVAPIVATPARAGVGSGRSRKPAKARTRGPKAEPAITPEQDETTADDSTAAEETTAAATVVALVIAALLILQMGLMPGMYLSAIGQ